MVFSVPMVRDRETTLYAETASWFNGSYQNGENAGDEILNGDFDICGLGFLTVRADAYG